MVCGHAAMAAAAARLGLCPKPCVWQVVGHQSAAAAARIHRSSLTLLQLHRSLPTGNLHSSSSSFRKCSSSGSTRQAAVVQPASAQQLFDQADDQDDEDDIDDVGAYNREDNPDSDDDPFAELGIREIADQVGGVRVRQHVNPLKAALTAPLLAPNWPAIFHDPTLPLWVDIGCGSGRFLMLLAARQQKQQLQQDDDGPLTSTSTTSTTAATTTCYYNFLGLDVRHAVVERAHRWSAALHLHSTLHFALANATVHLDALLAGYPGAVARVTLLCPDPHFKKRHRKRRVVQPPLVRAVARRLAPGGTLFAQSDVREVAEDMRAQFAEAEPEGLVPVREGEDGVQRDADGWVVGNPVGVPSEREVYALKNGGAMYRLLYRKKPASQSKA